MRSLLAVLLLLALSAAALAAAYDADGAETGVLLYEVNVYGDDEGISLHNYGSSAIDLKGYTISDYPQPGKKEGYISFESSLKIPAGGTITVAKTKLGVSSQFLDRYPTYYDGDKGIKYNSSFALANDGDDLYLIHSGKIVDSFCFGKTTITDDGLWTGESFTTKKGCFAVRVSTGHDASSWYNYQVGHTNLAFDPDLKIDAKVSPFLMPESGGIPIYNALSAAKESVYITMYELTAANVYALLCDLEKRGVDVTVLLERSPLGYSSLSSDAKKMKALEDAGGEVMFIGGDSDRFTYVHAKYSVIDGKTVVITSENWVTDNLNGKTVTDPEDGKGNRGWGAIIESKEYASFMMDVFANDSDRSYGDVFDFEDVIVNVDAAKLSYSSPTVTYDLKTYNAKVTPILSPDNSWDATLYYIDNAKDRVYSEQQSLTDSYANVSTESPIRHMAQQAGSGLDVRFILSSTNDTEKVLNQIEKINVSSHIKAAAMNKPYVHNKGLICDDTVLVSSVNWTSSSFQNNRETCAAIHSHEVAEFFASAFLMDFDRNYGYSGLDVTITELTVDKDYQVTAGVTVRQEGTFTYQWDIDGTKKTTSAPRTVMKTTEGKHTLTVTVSSPDGSTGFATKEFGKDVPQDDPTEPDSPSDPEQKTGIFDSLKEYLIPIAIMIVCLIAAAIKMLGGKH